MKLGLLVGIGAILLGTPVLAKGSRPKKQASESYKRWRSEISPSGKFTGAEIRKHAAQQRIKQQQFRERAREQQRQRDERMKAWQQKRYPNGRPTYKSGPSGATKQ